MPTEKLFKQLNAQLLSPESFQPYGQVIYASIDCKPYDSTDAQLLLQNGMPRFYIMVCITKAINLIRLRATSNVLNV